jgi:Fe-S cluster assembly ATP-binding protein
MLMPGGLVISGLSYSVGERHILDGLSLDVPHGTIHALIGTNGTGKSTLAYIIMGLDGYRPSAGSIVFNGQSLENLPIHQRAALGITLAWQEPVRFEGISIRDYLSLKIHEGLDPEHCLRLVGLDPGAYLQRNADRSLSGGERKRVELASALAVGPTLAILDEPDSGIDILSIEGVVSVIRAFRESGAGVLVITHREEIAAAADRASHLCYGRIVNTGDPAEVTAKFREMKCLSCAGSEEECASA